ncbi:uncharacterized protein N0V89_000340 [Didymosphaeria variabile]|uniref:Glycosyltransferase family 25 protein n=1 Tax=Didymosphaeria variabile TaxID=1932322 RepID=A0A9W8XU42_9PLEO|nr:uncharacterized protein N0V89_000340 [Didymosphaeria variabile]KAJ4359784.1 hypothetical protein N0V89_000340 [Didymosphaeria variabile]
MQEKAYPPGNHRSMSSGNLGSWRAHMDIIREIVVQNLSTALVLEDDVDWDVRIRTQLLSFSQATRKLSSLAQELGHEQDIPPAFETKSQNPVELAKRSSLPLMSTVTPKDAYGRDWDVLWLGHCGANLPPPSPAHRNRLILLNDVTVPAPKHLRLRESSSPDPIATLYPPHTRVYHQTSNSTFCTLAYAVTQGGARKILFELGVRALSKGFDFALSDYCGGLVKGDEAQWRSVERKLNCVTVQPPLFSHHWNERGKSDIMGLGIGGRPEAGSRYVIRSVRANLEGFAEGSDTLFEQWSD